MYWEMHFPFTLGKTDLHRKNWNFILRFLLLFPQPSSCPFCWVYSFYMPLHDSLPFVCLLNGSSPKEIFSFEDWPKKMVIFQTKARCYFRFIQYASLLSCRSASACACSMGVLTV